MAREEQAMPVQNDSFYCQESLGRHILDDLDDSLRRGEETYGTGLQPFNGRNVAQDAYEEWIDLGLYLEQWKIERREVISLLRRVVVSCSHEDIVRHAKALLEGMNEK